MRCVLGSGTVWNRAGACTQIGVQVPWAGAVYRSARSGAAWRGFLHTPTGRCHLSPSSHTIYRVSQSAPMFVYTVMMLLAVYVRDDKIIKYLFFGAFADLHSCYSCVTCLLSGVIQVIWDNLASNMYFLCKSCGNCLVGHLLKRFLLEGARMYTIRIHPS